MNAVLTIFGRLIHWRLGDLNIFLNKIICNLILVSDAWDEIALRYLSLDLTDDKSTLVQVMAWCHQARSHYLNQCWTSSISPYGVTKPQWVLKHMVAYFRKRHYIKHLSRWKMLRLKYWRAWKVSTRICENVSIYFHIKYTGLNLVSPRGNKLSPFNSKSYPYTGVRSKLHKKYV